MGKYKEAAIAGSQWVQLGKAKIFFDPEQPTRIIFNEERVRQIDGGTVVTNLREFEVVLDAPSTTFVLVKPDDNAPTGGDMTYRQLERALYSLYYDAALKLDAQG
jgi:hypothetical protein